MSEKFLDVADRAAVPQKGCRCRVAKNMGRDGRGDARPLFCSAKRRPDGIRRQSRVLCGDEQSSIGILAQRQVLRKPFQRAFGEEYEPRFVPLPQHLGLSFFEVHVVSVEPQYLRDAHARGEEHFYQRS